MFLDNWLFEVLFGLTAAVLVLKLIRLFSSFVKDPPGPYGVPLLGYYPFIANNPVLGLRQLGAKYDDIFTITLLGEKYYFLNSVKAMKEALSSKSLLVTDRPVDSFTAPARAFGQNSIVTSGGEFWAKHLKFMLENFASQGVGKLEFGAKIHDALELLTEYIEKKAGQDQDLYEYLVNYSCNITTHLLFSKQYDINDPEYITLRDNVREYFTCVPDLDSILHGPVFRLYLMLFKPGNYNRLKTITPQSVAFWEPMIKERLNVVDKSTARDLLDCYLCEYKEELAKNKGNKYFDLETIIMNLFVMFIGGLETTSTFLYHAINLMALHPNVQKKVQEEIDEKVGKRKIFMSDKSVLNYTYATLSEIQRYVSLGPLGFTRRNFGPIQVVGYSLPPKSNIVVNIWKLSKDPRYFKNPNHFDPNNFLTEDGQFVKNEAHIPFSYGKRMCTGFQVAEVSTFIAFSTLMQKFKFEPPTGEEIQRNIHEGLVRFLLPYKVKVLPRI